MAAITALQAAQVAVVKTATAALRVECWAAEPEDKTATVGKVECLAVVLVARAGLKEADRAEC